MGLRSEHAHLTGIDGAWGCTSECPDEQELELEIELWPEEEAGGRDIRAAAEERAAVLGELADWREQQLLAALASGRTIPPGTKGAALDDVALLRDTALLLSDLAAEVA